jgi:hypothetical protein
MPKIAATLLILLLIPVRAHAWGEKGHLMVNRLAVEKAGNQLPEFMSGGRNQLIYDGYEPDRWRDEVNTPMNTAQAADHFMDSELWGPISTIEPDRFAFMEKVAEKKIGLVKIGYLPYAIIEMYDRLRNAFRQWRNAKTAEDRDAARVDALVYAGILGHYTADGSNPMHLTINYDFWLPDQPNPKGYRTTKGLHSQFETAYVNSAVNDADVRPKVQAPQRLPNVFAAIKDYLSQTFGDLDKLYSLEKEGDLNPSAPKAPGTEFVSTELARGATMLGNLWYTAWLESAEPAAPPRPPRP